MQQIPHTYTGLGVPVESGSTDTPVTCGCINTLGPIIEVVLAVGGLGGEYTCNIGQVQSADFASSEAFIH